jgi:hypothetical protein
MGGLLRSSASDSSHPAARSATLVPVVTQPAAPPQVGPALVRKSAAASRRASALIRALSAWSGIGRSFGHA